MLTNLLKNTPRVLLLIAFMATAAFAQTTTFTYQGKLEIGGTPTNSNHDFEFKLFDSLAGGTQQGSTAQSLNVAVTNGIFAVSISFGACPTCFNGANRFLEISARPAGGGAFTTLSPRQQVTSTPYAIRSSNAAAADDLSTACVNCVRSSQILSVSGSQITGAIPVLSVPAGSTNYVQNRTTVQPGTTDFNITGSGTLGGTLTANAVNSTTTLSAATIVASTQYNLGANRILSTPATSSLAVGLGAGNVNTGPGNTFVGSNAGISNTTGTGNTFIGSSAGISNTAEDNTFVGLNAGLDTTTGANNTFVGARAGISNQNGLQNSFFGSLAGSANSTGDNNSYFGYQAGQVNSAGNSNSFFGMQAGKSNTGSLNSFFGSSAGSSNISGGFNAFFGANAGLTNSSGTSNSFFGAGAGQTNTSGGHNSFFGSSAGDKNTASDNSFFGALAGFDNTSGQGNSFFGSGAGRSNTVATSNSFFGFNAGTANVMGAGNSFFGAGAGDSSDGNFNSFFGLNAGQATTSGDSNAFFGPNAGTNNITGDANTMLGFNANSGPGLSNLTNATAIGANSVVSQSNSLVLGSGANVGIGTSMPQAKLTVAASTTSSADNTATFTAANIGPNQSHIHFGTTGNWFIRSAASTGRVTLQDTGGNVGIGTSSANAKLQVTGGNIYVTAPGSLIITSPNGNCWFITVNNSGVLSTNATTCP